jgi:addiction module antitoxin, relB/dinJ family
MATVNISIKIDEKTKKEAQELFKDLGLSLSTAINIFLKQAIREKGIPFYINSLPENSELAQAFEEAKQIKKNPSNYKSYSSPEEMFKDVLGEDYEG